MATWLDHALFYEIYPQTFYDTNADGIGDINGIIEKLDYIKDLGCNAIWLNPCFKSPFYDAGYDVEDYYTVAPRYGTNEDLRRLFEQAHSRGMHVLLDLVPGHTSITHEWFKASCLPTRNEYSDRYIWTGNIWERPEAMDCIRGFSQRNGCCAVNYYTVQPALNYGYAGADPDKKYQMLPEDDAPMQTRKAIKDIMRFWLKLGCDGFRVDMAGSLVKNDPTSAENIKLWQDFRAFLDEEFPEAVLVSEWGEPDKSIAGGFHMDFMLHFGPPAYNSLFRDASAFFSKKPGGDITVFKEYYSEIYAKANGRGLICIPSGNHDMSRLAYQRDLDDLKLCFAFLLSMPGAPFLYYGDEIGMQYLKDIPSVEGGFERTGSRTPMQWDNGPNAGFSCVSEGKTYTPIDPNPDRPTVQKQLQDPDSLLHEIKKLIALRYRHPALMNTAAFEFVYAEKESVPLIYRRFTRDEEILVVLNPKTENAVCRLPAACQGQTIYAYGSPATIDGDRCTAPACSATFIKIK